MKRNEIIRLVNHIKNRKILDFYEIPLEARDHLEIVYAERKMKLRSISSCGFDLLRSQFFVNETVATINELSSQSSHNTIFESFNEYYSFLEGNIYENACYYGYIFSTEEIEEYGIDTDRINYSSLIEETVDDCVPHGLNEDIQYYDEIENNKKVIKSWIDKYNACDTYEELYNINDCHRESNDETDEVFYLWNYIYKKGKDGFKTIMEFINNGSYPSPYIEKALPFVYGIDKVLDSYKYIGGAKSTCAKHNSKYKSFLRYIKEHKYREKTEKYFDKKTHYFCVVKKYCFIDEDIRKIPPVISIYRYFENFDEFSRYLENDLSDCNLSQARGIELSGSYRTNDNTILPVDNLNSLRKNIIKKYDRHKDQFIVSIEWKNSHEKVLFSERKIFKYFFDFCAFLKNDLSGADLLYCNGLVNLTAYSEINLKDIVFTSQVSDALGIKYESLELVEKDLPAFRTIEENEEKTKISLNEDHMEIMMSEEPEYSDNKVYYITDVHLMHKLIQKGARTKADCIYITQKIIDNILKDMRKDTFYGCRTLLIGGDVSSETSLFRLFVTMLRKTINELFLDVIVVFVLGNHELWNHGNKSLDEIVKVYRSIITNNGMYLLYDEIMYIENQDNVSYIGKKDILSENRESILKKLRKARLILFGGIGFSGCNNEFNADQGIYRDVLNREEEISLSKEFECLYDRVIEIFQDRTIIVFTHMGIFDWKGNCELHDGYIYVSGHNHRNEYYDDGVRRLYADNQVGYRNDTPHLKYFLVDNSYDWFTDYSDGIHEISKEDYIEFYRGKNIHMNYNREAKTLYMLKKRGYYCFIQRNKSGKLSILNGGSLKSLYHSDIDYYFNNMDDEIRYIKSPLEKYQKIQKEISNTIREIGGNGRIHGAIVDIDGDSESFGDGAISYNHLYLNPIDLSITPYYARDMITKYVYPSFAALIYAKCPKLFENYNNLLAAEDNHSLIIKPVDINELAMKPILYTSTDIYKASRELRKMQKLNSNILSTWYDNFPKEKSLLTNI